MRNQLIAYSHRTDPPGQAQPIDCTKGRVAYTGSMSRQSQDAEPTTETETDACLSSIDISVDVATVWEALVTDGGLAPWMGEGSSIEPEAGGALRLPDPVGGRTRSGRVDRVDEQSRLEFTWWPDRRPVERTTVTITIAPIDTGTRVTVTESVPRSIAGPSRPLLSADPRSQVVRGAWLWRMAMLGVATCMAAV